MNYPTIARDDKKSVKLHSSYHDLIKSLRYNGMIYQDIADKFDVSYATIWGIVNYERRQSMQQKSDYLRYLKHKSKIIERSVAYIKKRYHSDEQFRLWFNQQSQENYKKRKLRN